MARETAEIRNDPSPHSPLKHHVLLAKLLLEADQAWLVELRAFIVYRKLEFYGPLLDDAKRTMMALLRLYVENVKARSKWSWWTLLFLPRPCRP